MTLRSLDHGAYETVSRPSFRIGQETPPLDDHLSDLQFGDAVDVEAVRTVIDEAMRRFGRTETSAADAWLAPRLHYCLRLSRRQAADAGLWRWLGAAVFPDYVRWRWGTPDTDDPEMAAKTERFIGPDYKHALARLWWTAELGRDGSDYSPASIALETQDIQNNLFRMDVAHHRPTVQAALRVLEGRGGDPANALAKATNSAATTLVLDVVAPDEPLFPDATTRWLADAADVDPNRYLDELPPGPEDPPVPQQSVEVMVALLTELLDEAPHRDRSATTTA
jgi:hypothetical protein